MSEHTKQLHIRKNSTVTDIKLYTTTSDVSSDYITLRDSSTTIYAKLGDVTDSNASDLRIRKNGIVYTVLKQTGPTLFTPTNQYSYTIIDGSPTTISGTKLYTRSLTTTNATVIAFQPSLTKIARITFSYVATVMSPMPYKYVYYSSGGTLVLEGSNDKSNWTKIQQFTIMDISTKYWKISLNGTPITIDITVPYTPMTYYRFNCLTNIDPSVDSNIMGLVFSIGQDLAIYGC